MCLYIFGGHEKITKCLYYGQSLHQLDKDMILNLLKDEAQTVLFKGPVRTAL
jgi:hypothetical protein